MVTSKAIINNLKKEDVSSLLEDLQVLLNATDDKCQAFDICSVLKAAYHLMKSHKDPTKQDKVISNLVPSINFCINYIKENNISDESLKQQFLQILYHIISIYLKLELYADSLSSVANLKTLLVNEQRPANDKENYTKFLSALFWNEALKLEKKNESLNFEISFKLRCQAIEFTLFDNNLSTVKNYTYLTLVRYCYNNEQRDSSEIISFLKNVWVHMWGEKINYDHLQYLFKLLYSWFEVSVNYCTDISIINYLLSLMSKISSKVESIKVTNDEKNILKSCLDVSKYAIRIFLLTEKVNVSTSEVLKYEKLFNNNVSDLAAHTSAFFYLSFLKTLNSSESDNLLSLIKPNLAFCITFVVRYLHIFPELKLHKGLPFNVNSDITLAGAFVKVISLLIKNENTDEKRKILIIEAEDFIRVSLDKLKTDARNIEFQTKFSNWAKAIGNIGFTSYNSGFYSESIYFLETGLKYALFDKKDIERSFKWRQILVYCYFLSGNHKMGLQNVAMLMLDYKDKSKECMELWHKVKRDAIRNKEIAVTSSTISNVLDEMNVQIDREEEISLLVEELRGCKLERCPSEEEILNIVKKLVSLECSGHKWAYVMLIIITMGFSRSEKISSFLNKSTLDMCIETVNLFKEFITENPTYNEVKIQLSIGYVWLFFLQLQKLRKQAEKEGATYLEPKSDEEESESDIMPTIPLLTFLVEAEIIKNLEMALELWTDISRESKTNWIELAELVKNWDLLTIIEAAAEFFSISAHDVLELRTWILLQRVSSAVKNKECELNSSIALINFLVRMGYLEMASQLLKITDSSDFNGDESKVLRLKLQLAESNLMLQKGQFDEGLILLRKVSEDSVFKKSYRSTKMLQIQYLMLQSKFLLVPPSAFNKENVKYLSVNNAISSAMDCASSSKRLLKLLTEKQTVEGYNDWIVLRSQLLKNILNAYLLLAEHYIQIGDPRFSRCFLLEGLKIAEENILTFWSSKMLILLGQVDLICKDINDCMVKLNCLKYVMDENSKENASMLLHKTFNNTEKSESLDVSEDFIISSETRLNFKRIIKQNFINNSDVQSSPITNKRETNSKFEVKSNAHCDQNMFSIYLLKLEIWALSCLHLIAEDKTSLAETQLKKLLKKCELMKNTNEKVCLVLKTFIGLGEMDSKIDVLLRVPSLSERMLLVSTLHRLSILHFTKGNFKLTSGYLESALELCSASKYETYLYSNTYGLLKYHETVVSLKTLIGINPDSCLEFVICPSVEVKGLASKKVLKDSAILNVTPQKANIPKIYISPCGKRRTCKAPLKKDVLPVHIKKDMKEISKSNAFSSLIFSSSDDELLKSPMPSAPKKSSKKTNSTTLYKESFENEKNSYKLFKSKNSDLNINASCDIWKFPDLATPKVNKISKSNQAATMSLRKTRQNTRIAKSDTNCSSKLLDPTSIKQTSKSRTNKRSVLCSTKDSQLESNKDELYGSDGQRASIEHYRGTSKSLQKQNVLEDITMEEDVFYPDCSEDILYSKKQPRIAHLPLDGKHSSVMDTLCDDLNAMDMAENIDSIMKYKIPDEKLMEFINCLDEIRLLVQHNAPYPLYVNLCKLLAVLIMYKNANLSKTHDCAFLLSETFASILRQIYLGNYTLFKEKANTDNSPHELSMLLKRKDTCIIEQMESLLNVLPEDFTVVQITPLFEKESETSFSKCNVSKLIICRYQKNSQPLVMCLNSSTSEMSTTSIFAEFGNILSESTLIMKNNDDRRSWWTTRSTLDMRLKSLVKCIEDTWVGCWKGLLLSSSTNEKRVKHLRKIRDSICKLSEPSNKTLLEVLLDSASFLSRGQLSAAICHLWNCKPSDEIFLQIYKSIHETTAELPETKRNPLTLILDKDIQALPWESLPILNDVPVSRMPSLNIMISKLSMSDNNYALQKGLDCSNAYYILNPGGDLKYSQEYFQPLFEKQANWKGIVGKPPTAEECALALKECDLFVYCGHGSGKQYLEGKTIDKMRCHASAILMGCSSGRLKQFGKQLEAYGIPLTYLMNGCPCVVGNLWDVTDKDIDRFTDKLFELFVPNYKEKQDTTDVATAVSDARSACKMRYLVGSAPIIYGFPVFAKK